MATDLEQAFEALSGKLAGYTTALNYYHGDQPTVYSTDRLREAFGNINTRFVQNWIAVVVNAVLDRIVLKGWDAQDQGANNTLDNLWNQLNLYRDTVEAHRDALITREGFIIAWPAQDGTIDCYHNDPRLCHVFYEPDRPKVKRFAAKWWTDGENYYLNLYYPDRIEHYFAKTKDAPSSAKAFQPAIPDREPNSYGIIPVFHLKGESELNSITDLQDAVNKLFADMMVAAEFGAFPQRYVISHSDTAALKNGPNIIWEVPASDGQGEPTQVGAFPATPLDNYLSAIDKIASSIAIISRTPKHYFFAQGGDPSGEALLAMEAPLTKKVKHYQQLYGTTWRELAAFLLRLQGESVVDPAAISPVWQPAESIQPYTEAQTLQTNTSAGIPLVTALKRQGWSEQDIQQMQKDKQEQDKQALATGQLLLQQARIQSEQDNNPDGSQNGNNGDNQEE